MKNKHIFINLPVQDLAKSKAFFQALGYSFDPRYEGETGACLILGENLFSMLMTLDLFQSFSPKPISDATKTCGVFIRLSCDSRDEVNALVQKAIAAGGVALNEPEDHGFMYEHAFQDLDGHAWDIFWMDPSALPQG